MISVHHDWHYISYDPLCLPPAHTPQSTHLSAITLMSTTLYKPTPNTHTHCLVSMPRTMVLEKICFLLCGQGLRLPASNTYLQEFYLPQFKYSPLQSSIILIPSSDSLHQQIRNCYSKLISFFLFKLMNSVTYLFALLVSCSVLPIKTLVFEVTCFVLFCVPTVAM